ncbi:MAG TPA: hypothetical protein VHY57_10670 [Rhizomicrobium sp.]|nr:hypothetical protein [Rhizomicrobium sp.]
MNLNQKRVGSAMLAMALNQLIPIFQTAREAIARPAPGAPARFGAG